MALSNFKTKNGIQVADSNNPSGFDLLPVGSLMFWAGPTASIPAGWLLCNGATVSRTTYSDLSAVLSVATPSYPYGNGDGSTTFHLPDASGRALSHEGFAPTNTAKQLAGAETQTLTDSNIVSHTHTVNTHSHTGINSHTHTGTSHTHTTGSHTHDGTHAHSISLGGSHTHSIYSVQTSSTGAGPLRGSTFVATQVVTQEAAGGAHTHGNSTPSGATDVGIVNTILGGIASNVSTLDSATASSGTGPSSTTNTEYNGGPSKSSFTLMQPFVALNVIIKV